MPDSASATDRKGKFQPKGRMTSPQALNRLSALLADEMPLQHDRLIEYLHLIQDKYRHLSAENLSALAYLMKLPQAEIWEVASFYDHFDLVKEGETPPPARTIRICTSLSCMMAGAQTLLSEMQDRTEFSDEVRFVPAPCLGACDNAPAIADGHQMTDASTAEDIIAIANTPAPESRLAGVITFKAYRANGGYQLANTLREAPERKSEMLDMLDKAALRGLGGAGFPTGRKWRIVASQPEPRLMAVNGDEGEPGTFKDRHYLSTDPHRMIEGILVAGQIVGIENCYIYMRDEYPEIILMLHEELAAVRASGLADHMEIELRRGAGAYICGEESAMIESIEGKRGLPRHRPPYVAENGLFGRPTLVNNVETLFWIRDILELGADWFNAQGSEAHPGFRTYSVSGRVARPGIVKAPAGSTAEQLIEACGGMAEGHHFKAYLPGGASGGILPASKADIPLDFGGKLAEEGCFVGSHAIVILSQQDNMWQVAHNLLSFFRHESCGQCTPCRTGTDKAVQEMSKSQPDTDRLMLLSQIMADASICGLGQAASNPLISVMKHFPEEVGTEAVTEQQNVGKHDKR